MLVPRRWWTVRRELRVADLRLRLCLLPQPNFLEPRKSRRRRARSDMCRLAQDPAVEDPSYSDEEGENYDLDEQTRDNDFLAILHVFLRLSGHETGARTLCNETQNISSDEKFREPFGADQGVVLAVNQKDDPAECHVDGCGVQRWSDEQRERLDDEEG